MITFKRALEIHAILIDRFGGTLGVRDHSLLESALNRPYLTYDRIEVYPSATEKAAVMLEGILKNYPFVDGNKRTGYVLARLTLLNKHFDIAAKEDEKYQFMMQISTGMLDLEQITKWLKEHTVYRN